MPKSVEAFDDSIDDDWGEGAASFLFSFPRLSKKTRVEGNIIIRTYRTLHDDVSILYHISDSNPYYGHKEWKRHILLQGAWKDDDSVFFWIIFSMTI